MWGQVLGAVSTAGDLRIIPMRVGTRITPPSLYSATQDHPHACGDKCGTQPRIIRGFGSSPCVWGQVNPILIDADFTGIIPMRVGTSIFQRLFFSFAKDHPHACGDKTIPVDVKGIRLGSSPCVWGQVMQILKRVIILRIIPMRGVGTRLKKSRKIAVLQNQPLRFPLTFHRSFV